MDAFICILVFDPLHGSYFLCPHVVPLNTNPHSPVPSLTITLDFVLTSSFPYSLFQKSRLPPTPPSCCPRTVEAPCWSHRPPTSLPPVYHPPRLLRRPRLELGPFIPSLFSPGVHTVRETTGVPLRLSNSSKVPPPKPPRYEWEMEVPPTCCVSLHPLRTVPS